MVVCQLTSVGFNTGSRVLITQPRFATPFLPLFGF